MNVSLNGSTLTVNVDGHSDSVLLEGVNPPIGDAHFSTAQNGGEFVYRCTWSVLDPSALNGITAYATFRTTLNNTAQSNTVAATAGSCEASDIQSHGRASSAVLYLSSGQTYSVSSAN